MPRSRTRVGNALRFLLVGCATACESAAAPFDPTGNELALYGEWDVNGLVPGDEVCTRAKIDSISVIFSNADGTETFTSPEFSAPCARGFIEDASPVLRRGSYRYRWVAYYQGAAVLESQRYDSVESLGPNGPEVELMAVDFLRRVDVQINAALAFDTGSGFGSCSQAQADSLSWELRAGSSTGNLIASSGGSRPCVENVLVADEPTGILAAGDYVLAIHASSTDGASWATDCPVHVHESGASVVTCDLSVVP